MFETSPADPLPQQSAAADPAPTAVALEAALALLNLVPAVSRLALDATQAESSITPKQAALLHPLLGGPRRASDIASVLRITRAAAGEGIARLVDAGLVRSEADPTDARARLLSVTPTGVEAIERFGRVTASALGSVVMRLPPEQQAELASTARALLSVFHPQSPRTE